MKNPPYIGGTFEALKSIKVFGRVDRLFAAFGTDENTYDLNNPLVIPKCEFYAKQVGCFVEINTNLGFSLDAEFTNSLSDDPRLNIIGIWENSGKNGSKPEWVLSTASHKVNNGRWTIRPTKVDEDNTVQEIDAIYVESGKDHVRVGGFVGAPVFSNETQYPCLAQVKAT